MHIKGGRERGRTLKERGRVNAPTVVEHYVLFSQCESRENLGDFPNPHTVHPKLVVCERFDAELGGLRDGLKGHGRKETMKVKERRSWKKTKMDKALVATVE